MFEAISFLTSAVKLPEYDSYFIQEKILINNSIKQDSHSLNWDGNQNSNNLFGIKRIEKSELFTLYNGTITGNTFVPLEITKLDLEDTYFDIVKVQESILSAFNINITTLSKALGVSRKTAYNHRTISPMDLSRYKELANIATQINEITGNGLGSSAKTFTKNGKSVLQFLSEELNDFQQFKEISLLAAKHHQARKILL